VVANRRTEVANWEKKKVGAENGAKRKKRGLKNQKGCEPRENQRVIARKETEASRPNAPGELNYCCQPKEGEA